jgi:two-component sensor histidine kinase
MDGAVMLLRDVSELRSRDRLLISKDATIKEIHHRVKNNLQTISSLLRLQGRRLAEPSAKAAIEESVRRIGSIALVHETLSRESGDEVDFDAIVRPLVRMVEEGLTSPDRPLRFEISGGAGGVGSPAATSLAVVLTELLQNVMDHAYPPGSVPPGGEAVVRIELSHDPNAIRIVVRDDGVGPVASFEQPSSTSLGLSIVRGLVSDLRGTIEFGPAGGPPERTGTRVVVTVPLRPEV